MTDRTCSTCKHWTRHPWPNRLGWHDTGTCATLHVTPAHTISERDMFPMLDTHRDFGCVKWDGERREDINLSFPPAPTQAQFDRAMAILEARSERMRARREQDD